MIKKMYSSQALVKGMRLLMDDSDKILTAASKLEEIKNSGELTMADKQNARAHLKVEIERAREDWLVLQGPVNDGIRQLKVEMPPARNCPDDVVGELRQREIRDYLRTLDPIDVEEKYESAARADDELFLSAIEQSPVPFNFATKGLVEKVSFSRLEKANPVKAKQLADLQTGKANVLSALKSVQAAFGKQKLDVADDPLDQGA